MPKRFAIRLVGQCHYGNIELGGQYLIKLGDCSLGPGDFAVHAGDDKKYESKTSAAYAGG